MDLKFDFCGKILYNISVMRKEYLNKKYPLVAFTTFVDGLEAKVG